MLFLKLFAADWKLSALQLITEMENNFIYTERKHWLEHHLSSKYWVWKITAELLNIEEAKIFPPLGKNVQFYTNKA